MFLPKGSFMLQVKPPKSGDSRFEYIQQKECCQQLADWMKKKYGSMQ
jgi:hypothetical protein